MTASTPIDPATVEFALWGTQGGGLARLSDDGKVFMWHELPDWYPRFPEITEKIGDQIPQDWDLIPANEAAHNEMRREEEGLADPDSHAPELELGRQQEMY